MAGAPSAAMRAAPLVLLRGRDFRRTWLAGALAGVMRWLDMLAVAVYVLEATGSPLTVALALFLRMLPMFLFGAIAGACAERVDRRRLLILSLLVLAAVYFVLFWLAATGALRLWQLAIGVFLSGLFWALELPIRRTMIAELAGMERIGAAMGLDSSTNNFTRMLGPLVGGALFALFGIQGTLALGAALYVTAAALLAGVAYETVLAKVRERTILMSFIEGIAFVRSHRTVTAVMAITVFLNMFGFSFTSMVPVIARESLGLGPFPTGLLMSAEGLGAFLGSLSIAFFAAPRDFNRIFLGGAMTYLCCIVLFALSVWVWASMPLLFIGGLGISGFAAMQSALVIANSPPAMRNRVMGVLTMCIGVGPIGILMVGVLADHLGAATGVLVMALAGALAIIASSLAWPEIRRPREP